MTADHHHRRSLEQDPALLASVRAVAAFEAPGRIAGAPAGRRRDGARFEVLVDRMYDALADHLAAAGATERRHAVGGGRAVRELAAGGRAALLPSAVPAADAPPLPGRLAPFAEPVVRLADLLDDEAILGLAPSEGPFRGALVADMVRGSGTRLDRGCVLLDGGEVVEATAREAKSGKVDGAGRLEGNAHERLAFQMAQFAEMAERDPRWRLLVIGSSAFIRGRNRYLVGFGLLARRLARADPSLRIRMCWGERGLLDEMARVRAHLAGEDPDARPPRGTAPSPAAAGAARAARRLTLPAGCTPSGDRTSRSATVEGEPAR